MIIQVKVIPNASHCEIKIEAGPAGTLYKIKLPAPANDGKANDQLIEVLSEHFQVPKRNIALLSGEKNRHKRIKIEVPGT